MYTVYSDGDGSGHDADTNSVKLYKSLANALAIVGSIVVATCLVILLYKYKCMKCKLIQEYGQPGPKKCPNDGQMMVRQN
jgi:hypothetical protein